MSPAVGPAAPPPVEVVPPLPEPVRPPDITAILGRVNLPDTPAGVFTGVMGAALVAPPVGTEAFEGAVGGADVRMEFPGGGSVFTHYTIGVPLGAERPVLQPRVLREPAEVEEPSR